MCVFQNPFIPEVFSEGKKLKQQVFPVMLLKRIAHLDALISSERGCHHAVSVLLPPSHPPAAQQWYAPSLDAFSSLTGTQSSSVPPEPRSFQRTGASLAPRPPTKRAAASPSRHETDSERTDEDEQDMPDGICHLFGILYSGHLLFPKYVPTR